MNSSDCLIELLSKSFGVNSVGCPFGSCTEFFLLKKAIEIVEISDISIEDKERLIKAFSQNPYRNNGRFSNGKHAGLWYINIIKENFTIDRDKADKEKEM